jgi:hypothetical protein
MRKLEFNPTIIDYSENNTDMENIYPGVKKYVATSKLSLKDAIEKLSIEELKQAFEEKRSPYRKIGLEYFPTPLTKLYQEFLEPTEDGKNKGVEHVYNLVCEKVAMEWMNER